MRTGGREEAAKGLQAESFQQNLLNNPVGREETFLQTFLVEHVEQQFSVPTFCGSVWKSWREVPIVDDVLSSHEQEIYTTTSLAENCIEFEFQTDRNYYVDLRQSFLALKLKYVKGSGYDTYESKEKKKEHKDESVVFTKTGDDEEEEQKKVARVTYADNIKHSIFSNVEVYINNQQIYNSNGLYAHKSYISNNFKAAISEYKGVLHCEGYDYEHDPEDISNLLPDPFFTRRMKLLSRPDGFMLYGKLRIDFFSTSELLYPNMKIRLRLIRARPNFYMISDNPNVSLGIVDCSLYTRRIALKDDYHKKRMDMLAYAPVEYNYLETLAKTFIIPARQNQFIQEKNFNNAFISRIAIAMNTNSAFTGSFTENPFWCQKFDLRQIRILRGGQPIVDFDTADNCCLYATTMKTMNFQDDIPSVPIDDFKDHYVLVFDLTSMQDATENCHYPELVGEPLRLELNFTIPLENVTELIVLGERMSSVAVDKFGVVGKNVYKWTILLCNKLSIVSFCSNFGTSVHAPQTMFQLSIMALLLLSTRNPAKCRVNIGS